MSNLSEEEIINKLKERIRIDRSMRLNVESDFDRFCEEECQAIEGLIDLYNKEKEKNKKLQKRNDRQDKIINKRDKQIDEMREIANKDWEERCRLTFELNNYISKEKKAYIDGTNIAHNLCNKKWEDKIKAKIEKVKDGTFDAKIVLQSLLEKE